MGEGGVEGRENVIRVYCMKIKTILNKRKNIKMENLSPSLGDLLSRIINTC